MAPKRQKTYAAQLIDKYAEEGPAAFTEEEAAELFLSFATGMSDSRSVLENLRAMSFGSFFDFSEKELKKRGLGESAVFLISSFPQIANRCINCLQEPNELLVSDELVNPQESGALKTIVFSKFIGVKSERVLLMLFNRNKEIIDSRFVNDGDGFSASIEPTKICAAASSKGAHYVLIAHNHPSGSGMPSLSDCSTTIILSKMLSSLGIKLIDHYIVTRTECESIKIGYEFYENLRE